MLFQNTAVTRGTAAMVVTATGMQTEMGQIATMLTSVTRTRSPLQKELGSLTKVLGIIAWGAVAFIVVVGVARGEKFSDVLLLGTAMAISAIPTGMPAFVSGLLSIGAKQLAEAKAVVKNLTDVETLGATSAINTDKTGTLTMNQMMVSTIYADGAWFTVEGEGYRKTGAITGRSRAPRCPTSPGSALGLVLDSDATVADDGSVVGDPTEAALVVLAAKLGVDAEETRRAYPRLAEVPFDSDYKFMATFHRYPVDGADRVIELVKGGARRRAGPLQPVGRPAERLAGADRARPGPTSTRRTRAWARRVCGCSPSRPGSSTTTSSTRWPTTRCRSPSDLAFVGMVGIIDPLRAEAKVAVQTALGAGIDVRMITGDHAVTAQAIGETLGLGPGAISGAELQALSDEELARRLPELHVFGRVSPQDKLRLARLMQEQGLIVAMTGDAVNDAAALKQADIGVAMGSGSEVTKQAGRMILTDDNFGTLVHAVEIGRRVYEKVVSYVRYQMTQLLSLVMLFVAATAFDINQGVALTPLMVLYLLVFVTAAGVVVIAVDPGAPDVMHRPPRDPKLPITNRTAVTLWVVYAVDAVRRRADPARRRARRPEHRRAERLADDDVRRDGPRHRLQRAHQPARPGERAHVADPEGARRSRSFPRGADRAGDRAAGSPEGPADHLAHRQGVAGLHRSRRPPAARDRDGQVAPPPAGPEAGPRRPATRARPGARPLQGCIVSKVTYAWLQSARGSVGRPRS